jgi:pilus assembly protein CpaE
MNAMTSKDPVRTTPKENLPASEPLSLVTICLDKETSGVLKLFAESAPLVRIDRQINEYRLDDRESVQDWIGTFAPDVCLLDFDRDRRSAALVAERIHAEAPDTSIFAVSAQAQPDLIIQAMRSGCSEYLVKPLDSEQLLNAVARVSGRRKEKRETARAQVLAFVGAKGGCGVTTLVTQLGGFLSQTYSRKTLIVDLHRDFGDAALYLGLTKYRYHAYELAENTDRLDAELLQSFVLHHSSGVDLIPAPQGTEPARPLLPGVLVHTFDFLRPRYELILVDLPPGLNEEHLELIRFCDQINIVTIAEVSALRNVVRQTDYFAKKEIPSDRLRVILNRYQNRGIISEAQIEKVIAQKLFWKVPNQYVQVLKSISSGHPLGQSSNSEVARNLQEWAERIGRKPGEKDRQKSRGILGLWGS